MLTYGLDDIVGPAVMEEEDPLADTPERRGAKFPTSSQALRHALGQSIAHVMYEQVREEIDWPVLKHRAVQGWRRLHCRRMTQRAANRASKPLVWALALSCRSFPGLVSSKLGRLEDARAHWLGAPARCARRDDMHAAISFLRTGAGATTGECRVGTTGVQQCKPRSG